MAKIVRYNGNLVPFASSSLGTERTLFGEVTQADDITSQFTADFLRGWGIVGPSDQPTLQDFNAVSYTHGQILSYLHQTGVPEYNATQEYYIGSITNVSGVIYRSLVNANVGNNPETSPASWTSVESSASRVSGLIGVNNTGTPNTQFDFSAASVLLRNPTTGAMRSRFNTGVITNNILTAGPAANGRDQAGAFTVSQWLRFYFIWNPTTPTLATISSSAAPSVGPALPAGYTSWAYIGSVYFGSGSTLAPGNMRGSRFYYSATAVAISGGTSTVLVAVPIPTLVPPECGWIDIIVNQLAITSSGTGTYSVNAAFTTQVSSIFSVGFSGQGAASAVFSQSGPSKQISNFGQSFSYAMTVAAGTGPSLTVYVSGYSMPNGGE